MYFYLVFTHQGDPVYICICICITQRYTATLASLCSYLALSSEKIPLIIIILVSHCLSIMEVYVRFSDLLSFSLVTASSAFRVYPCAVQ